MSRMKRLEFTLRAGERLYLDLPGRGTVMLEVEELHLMKAKLGVMAPAAIAIDRAEVHEAKQQAALKK